MMTFENLNAIELNKTAGMILGAKPCKYGERLVQMTLDSGYLTLKLEKSHISKKGGRETTQTRTRVEVWHFDGNGNWTKITEAVGPETSESVLSFYVPDAQTLREKRLHHRQGGILTRDGYTVKSA